ncbi:MAG: AAA family ATPase [Arcicella sp.]|nr:AAA family ATPase [Arcicella sp.]
MIIELQNFGPIKSFKFDTDKDIHAIFGKNNIGKSYAISAVYLILKNLKFSEFQDFTALREARKEFENIVLEKTRNDTSKIVNIKNEVEKNLVRVFKNLIMDGINKSLKNSFPFENIQNKKGKGLLKIVLYFSKVKIIIMLDSQKQQLEVVEVICDIDFEVKRNQFRKAVDFINDKIILYLNNKDQSIEDIKYCDVYVTDMLEEDLSNSFRDIFFLPASRSGLYTTLNSFGAVFAELARSRIVLTSKIEIPSFSESISDYFLNLNNIDDSVISETYSEYFEKIEKDILKGTIGFDKTTRKYHYVPDNKPDMRFDLSSTSSMISEIAPIIAHLKYIIPLQNETPSILFIEEPEAHLHPEIQILLLEYFVKLSKGNLKIVMTSHSNYIFNKLSNMVISKEISPDRLSVSLMKMTPEGSIVEEGAMHMDEYGIEDDNFVDVAEQLYEERIKLLENINQ